MKAIFISIAILAISCKGFSQFVAGNRGITIKSNTVFSVNGFTIAPSQDLPISNNSLSRSGVPVPGNPAGSIARVYKFQSPIVFSGIARITYLQSELNGLPENNLQIAHSSDGATYTTTTGSIMNAPDNFVYNTIASRGLLAITVMRPNGARTEASPSPQVGDPSNNRLLLMGNPVRSEAVLSYHAGENGKAVIRLLDMNGKVLLIRNENVISGVNRFLLTVNSLRSGIYLVELSVNGEIKTLKLVKH